MKLEFKNNWDDLKGRLLKHFLTSAGLMLLLFFAVVLFTAGFDAFEARYEYYNLSYFFELIIFRLTQPLIILGSGFLSCFLIYQMNWYIFRSRITDYMELRSYRVKRSKQVFLFFINFLWCINAIYTMNNIDYLENFIWLYIFSFLFPFFSFLLLSWIHINIFHYKDLSVIESLKKIKGQFKKEAKQFILTMLAIPTVIILLMTVPFEYFILHDLSFVFTIFVFLSISFTLYIPFSFTLLSNYFAYNLSKEKEVSV